MIRKIILPILLVIALTACNLVITTPAIGPASGPTMDPQLQIELAVSQTFDAQTQIAQSVQQTIAAMVTDTPAFTFTPSLTPTPTFTLTPVFPTVSVSLQTNCRAGPGTAYDILGIMNVGQTAEVVGRSASSDNWIIKLPSNPAVICWLWGQYATVSGNTSGLVVYTPPPTPTPLVTFTVSYANTISCMAQYAFRFKIANNGSLTWQSIKLTITDNTTAAVFVHSHDTFRFYNGCILDSEQDDLMPGESGYVANVNPGQLGYNPAGHSFTAVVRLCSQNGLAGSCVEKTLSFNP